MPVFQPPVVNDRPPVYVNGQDWLYPATPFGPAQALMRHYGGQPRGRTVLKLNGSYVTVDVPSTDQVLAATEVYQGGHIYVISESTAAALTAAGYGDGIT